MLTALKSQVPTQHHATLDANLAACNADQATQDRVGGVLSNLIALLKSLGISINFGCLISMQVITAVIAAFSNPLGWIAVIQAYYACANPTPPTP